MADFPTFSHALIAACGEIPSTSARASDIKSPTEAGYVVTWKRTTRATRAWRVTLRYIDQADYATWTAFIATCGTFAAFNFTVPKAGGTYSVRFIERPSTPYSAPYWSSSFGLEEV